MAKAQAWHEVSSGAALTRRESRRTAELIVRASLAREPMERPSRSLPGLSRNDARAIRDDVVSLSLSHGQPVGLVCAHSSGEPVFVGDRMISYGAARILSADDRLSVAPLVGIRGPLVDLVAMNEPSEQLEVVLGLLVTRDPYDGGAVSAEDLICANAGAVHAALAVLPEASSHPALGIGVGPDARPRPLGVLPSLGDLRMAARGLLQEVETTSGRSGRIVRVSGASTEKITLLGTVLSEPLPLEAGLSIGLFAGGARVLEATAEAGYFI